MRSLLPLILAAIPLVPLLAGLIARGCRPVLAGAVTTAAAHLAVALSLAAAALLATGGPETCRWAPVGPDSAWVLSLRLDVLSVLMVVMVAFLGAVVLRFSRHYLDGDPAQGRFFSWMSLTLAAVLTLVLSGHLLLLLAAWLATSLCLHRLLLHHPRRAGAVFSARKKFVVSRLGELCLWLAALWLHRRYGTWELDPIFGAIARGQLEGLPVAGYLLMACAALKSAQFPFHSWLPDTMETPTPVSAFMHAGIINAGGFLMIRLAPLMAHAPGALNLLAVLGTITAALGAVAMLAQPSVKRALAYSTIAQMGFMLLQCGLGAFGLALIHLVAHSLYKAHAFLSAGSSIGALPRAAVPLRTTALALGAAVGAGLVVAATGAWHALTPSAPLHPGVFSLILAYSLAYGLARAWSVGRGARTAGGAVIVAAGIAFIGLGFHWLAGSLFGPGLLVTPPPALLGFVAAMFTALFVFQALLWRAGRRGLGRRLYVHALNGFYIGTYANRLLGRLWPQNLPA